MKRQASQKETLFTVAPCCPLRRIAAVLCLVFALSLLTACSGFNSRMRDHLGDEANYHSYSGTVCDVYYIDAGNNKVSFLQSGTIPDCDVVIVLTFDDPDTVRTFLGSKPNPEWALDEYRFAFDITKENHRILAGNGFYDAIAVNAPVEVTASSFIYMDSDFFLIAEVTCDGTNYLDFEDGIQNIRRSIEDRKSLL